MDDLELLKRVRARLERPEAWTQDVYCRFTNGGESLPPDSDEATCWCVVGAAMAEVREYSSATGDRIAELLGFEGALEEYASDWNDAPGRTHAEVLARLDAAIAAKEQP